jgi:hypothetical protein
MKKYILTAIILLGFQFAKSQVYNVRHNYAYNDTLRVRVKMAVIDVAVERYDTSTNASKRLTMDVLAKPNNNVWLDMFVFQICVLVSAMPTDAQTKTYVNGLWARCAILNTRN